MTSNHTNPNVDFYFEKAKKWQKEINILRTLVLECPLSEELKWGNPCYTLQKRNVVLIHAFKEYCALLFFKGALLKDPDNILVQQTENVQAARQIRFTSAGEIMHLKESLKSYIDEALSIEQAGLKVPLAKPAELVLTAELQAKLHADSNLRAAFEALTPGRQRAYNLYFGQPKQIKTREARIEKSIPQIMAGKGLND